MPDGSSIAIDSESMRAIVQRAILESLTPEAKELVIADAIKQLTLRPELPKDRYDAYNKPAQYGPSPLEQAFTRAVMEMSHEVVREYLGDADVKEQVKAILRAEIDKLIDQDKEDLDDYGGWPSMAISQGVYEAVKVKLERKKD